jgi:hypothetical protein
MRVVVELEPNNGETTGILAAWQATWGTTVEGGGIELADAAALSALLDLRKRCFDRSVTVNAIFPDNR